MNCASRTLISVTLLAALGACASAEEAKPTPTPSPPPAPSNTPIPPTPAPTATPTIPPTPTETPLQLPDTPVRAQLGINPFTTYKVSLTTSQQLPFDVDDLPVEPGSVEAQWFTSQGRYVVVFVGLDPAQTGPLCPGSSIQTSGGFLFISNAPTEEGACDGFPTLTTDPSVGPRLCKGTLIYVSAIPSDRQGFLFGTIEQLADEGQSLIGLTSTAQTRAGIPEIDLDVLCQ